MKTFYTSILRAAARSSAIPNTYQTYLSRYYHVIGPKFPPRASLCQGNDSEAAMSTTENMPLKGTIVAAAAEDKNEETVHVCQVFHSETKTKVAEGKLKKN